MLKMLAVMGLVAIGLVRAQSQPTSQSTGAVAFEAASVKPRAPGDNRFMFPRFFPGGRFVSNAPLGVVIAIAYNLPINPSPRLTGVPDWAGSMDAAYDIQATGIFPAGLSEKARVERGRLMLQALLADRFKLAIHRETKEIPVYALVVAKGGPKLQRADVEERDCPDPSATPPPAPGTLCHGASGGRGSGIHARALAMSELARVMEDWADRPLVDKTGIKGLYHIETTGWQPMQVAPFAPGAKQDGVDIADLPTIFTVFEKLGLKMESEKDKVDVYVVDHVEKPTEN
jgi:uncharacterized protein (TIGR03435 family)